MLTEYTNAQAVLAWRAWKALFGELIGMEESAVSDNN